MKKKILIWMAMLIPLAQWAQSPEENMMKYWKHRQQLNRFICRDALNVGPNAVSTTRGSFLVAAVQEDHINCVSNPSYGFGGLSDSDNCQTLGSYTGGSLAKLDTSHHMITTTGFPMLGIAPFTGNECGGLRYGADQTLELGYYISVLATEWRLLTNSGQDATATAEELWGALEAYERLDRNAELIYDPYPTTGVFDGYFLRDDLLNPHYPTMDDDGDGNPNFPGVGCATSSYNAQPGKGRAYFTSGGQYRAFSKCNVNVPSADQSLALLMGMSLVARCVDPGVIVFGEDLRGKAQYTAHLLVQYARDHSWNYLNPEGDNYPNRTGVDLFSYHMARAANNITGNNQTTDFNGDGNVPDALNDYHNTGSIANLAGWTIAQPAWQADPNTIPPLIAGWTPDNDVSLSQSLTASAISGFDVTGGFINDLASTHHLEGFALLRDYLHGMSSTPSTMMDEVERLLNIAPCDKFCTCDENCPFPGDGVCNPAHQHNCNTVDEWESINRWTHVGSRNGSGNKENHTGLDFMLMHNLYLLLNPGSVRHYANSYDGDRELSLPAPANIMGVVYYESHSIPGYYSSNHDIESVAAITSPFADGDSRNGNVTYRAGNSIRLRPGFRAEKDTYFHAYIDDFECGLDNEFHRMAPGLTVQTADATSVPLISKDASISVFPNPSLGEFQLNASLPEAAEISWNVYSMMGANVMSSQGGTTTSEYNDIVDLTQYPAGTYILVIQAGGQQHRFRLVKQ